MEANPFSKPSPEQNAQELRLRKQFETLKKAKASYAKARAKRKRKK